MTPDKKPEWFQLADADNSASTRKISKGLPIMALVAVAAIIGVGAIFAQPQEQSPANATEPVATKAPVAPGIANPLAKKPKGGEHEGREHGEHEGDDDEGDDD